MGQHAKLEEIFGGAPPFTILRTEMPYWQSRLSSWYSLGLQGIPTQPGAEEANQFQSWVLNEASGVFTRKSSSVLFVQGTTLGWKKRKRRWIGLGIKSEVGRGEDIRDFWGLGSTRGGRKHHRPKASGYNPGTHGAELMSVRTKWEGKSMPKKLAKGKGRVWGQDMMLGETPNIRDSSGEQTLSGTSVFDPVLCELMYRWFAGKPRKAILDPFAGGSVRGIVAAVLGHDYTGIELREEQVDANRKQWLDIKAYLEKNPTGTKLGEPTWLVGDSSRLHHLIDRKLRGTFDFLFTCPPYADLERYSDDPRDISTMSYGDFYEMYHKIIGLSLIYLAEDSFAVFVVGDIRDKSGYYQNFVSDTIRAFQENGAKYYNEAILVTSAGSLPIRTGQQMRGGRKLGKQHQNILGFVKGDWKRATNRAALDERELVLPHRSRNGAPPPKLFG